MTFRFLDHTADLYLEAEADSEAGVLREAAGALLRLVWDLEPPPASVWREVEIASEPAEDRIVSLLTELLFLVDAPDGWPVDLRDLEILPESIRFRVGFVPRETARPEGREVKAVSRRDLSLRETEGIWRASCLLDL
jgi:SHS2 domain-containing protein